MQNFLTPAVIWMERSSIFNLDGHPTSEVVVATCGKSYFQLAFEPYEKTKNKVPTSQCATATSLRRSVI